MCVLFFPMTSNMKMGAQKKNTNGTRKNYNNKITTITIKLESFFYKSFPQNDDDYNDKNYK